MSSACDPGWTDASFVDMGCLFFDTEPRHYWEAAEFCTWERKAGMMELVTREQLEYINLQLQVLGGGLTAAAVWKPHHTPALSISVISFINLLYLIKIFFL